MKLGFVFVLFAAMLAAQTPPPPNPEKPAEKAKLEGRVTSLTTGEPVRRVNLRLMVGGSLGAGSYTVASEADGKFLFENVEPGTYTLTAERAGFVRIAYGQRGPGGAPTPLTLAAGQHLKDIAFTLTPAGTLSGKITDDEGEPVQSAMVMLSQYAYLGGKRQLRPMGTAMSNDLGEFRVANVNPGKYYLSATLRRMDVTPSAPPPRKKEGEKETAFVTTYYPNAADAASAAAIHVSAGADMRGIDVKLHKATVFRIRGKVIRPDGPMQNVALTLFPKTTTGIEMFGPGNRTLVQDPKGAFEMAGVVPGSYSILAGASAGGRNISVRVPVDVGGEDVENLVIVIGSGLEIPGTVRVEGAPPEEKRTGVRVWLGPVDSNAAAAPDAQVSEDGKFKLSYVAPERYRIQVIGIPGVYIKSARIAGRDALEEGVDLRSGVGGTLEIVLSPNSAKLTGLVRNEKGDPAAGARVSIAMVKELAGVQSSTRIAMTDQNGNFQLSGLMPGEYKVYAWEELDFGLEQVVEFRKAFERSAATVKLPEKGAENVTLKLIPREAIEVEKAKLQ